MSSFINRLILKIAAFKKIKFHFGIAIAVKPTVPRGQQNCQEQISDGGLVSDTSKTANI